MGGHIKKKERREMKDEEDIVNAQVSHEKKQLIAPDTQTKDRQVQKKKDRKFEKQNVESIPAEVVKDAQEKHIENEEGQAQKKKRKGHKSKKQNVKNIPDEDKEVNSQTKKHRDENEEGQVKKKKHRKSEEQNAKNIQLANEDDKGKNRKNKVSKSEEQNT